MALFRIALLQVIVNGLAQGLDNHQSLKEVLGTTYSEQQHLICSDRPIGQLGNTVRLHGHVPDLRRYNFDKRAVSCIFNGIFILYENYNYNPNGKAAVYAETWGDNYNVNLNDFANKASSVRVVGDPIRYKRDTFNTYQYEYYQGSEQYFYQDATYTQVDNFGRSVIVTGCNPWTVYEYQNYGGQAACFYPADTVKCEPGFFITESKMFGMSGKISSVRRGCFSHNKVVGEPY